MNENPAATPPAIATPSVMGPRLAAAIIDIVLMIVLLVVMTALFGESTSTSSDDGSTGFSFSLSGAPFIAYVVILLGYYFILELTRGQTVGKMLTKVRVVSADGSNLTPMQAGIRTILRLIEWLPAFYLVAFIAIVASSQKQRLGDMAAKTLVVKA